MRDDQMSQATVQVGVTPEARKMNCTDEEARILLRSRGDAAQTGRFRRSLGPIGAVLEVLLFNRPAAMFYGTIGYWTFGLLTLGMFQSEIYVPALRSGIAPLDLFLSNPMVMWGLSFALLIIGLTEQDPDKRYRGGLYGPLAMLVVMPSVVISYVLSVIFGAIAAIVVPFALASTAPVTAGMVILLLLPLGYAAPFKMADELN